MKVLFVIEQTIPDNSFYVGFFKYLSSEKDCEITVLNLNESQYFSSELDQYIIEYIQLGKKKYLFSFIEIRRRLKIIKPDIIVAMETISCFYTSIANLLLGPKLIFSRRHGSRKNLPLKLQVMERFCFAASQVVSCVSPAAKKIAIQENRFFAKKIVSIFSGTSLKVKFQIDKLSRDLLKNYGKKFKFLIVSRLRKEKGIEELILAINLLKVKYENKFILFIVGAGYHEFYLKEKCRTLGLNNHVVFVGFTEDVEYFYRNCDLLIVPSYYDACPKSVIEGLEMKIPILATAVEGINDLITHKKSGILIPKPDIKIIATELEKFLKSEYSVEDLKYEGRMFYENNLTPEKMAKSFYKLFEKILINTRIS